MRRNAKKKEFKESTPFILEPKTQVQAEYMHSIENNELIVSTGCAGTGKTFIASAIAASKLISGEIDKVVLTRPNVATGKSLGAFPGTINEKMEPWLQPMIAAMKQVIGTGAYDCQIRHKNIEFVPIETIRGRSFDNAVILIDESQNLNMNEFKAISTRIGKNSKMIFMGDATQHDMNGTSDIKRFCEIISKYKIQYADVIEFKIEDIVRSDICASFVKAFYQEGV